MSDDPVLVESVTHRVGRTDVLCDVTLSAPAGALVVLSGRSGSGKTTLLHLMAGVVPPTSGRVVVLGKAAVDHHDWARVSLTPQHTTVAGGLTVEENVLLPVALHGSDPAYDGPGLLADLALDTIADRPAGSTSLGEQQRTCIARGLVLAPEVALLDEPTSHQDDDNVARVLAVLLRARESGSAIVVATHDPRVAAVADVILELAGGRLVASR